MQRLFLEFAVRAALIAAGTAMVLGILRVKSARARHLAWASLVVSMLVLPAWIAWGPKASVPLLPPVTARAASLPANSARALSGRALPETSDLEILRPPGSPLWNWGTCLAGVYLLGVCALLARLGIGTVRARRLVRTATDREGILTSSWCAAPLTVGWLRPTVILPGCWREWPQQQLDAVLTHEREHARRRDPLVQWLALLNRAVFWFHPLAWWLERRLSALAEEACDASVLARGHDPYLYSEYLLEMARVVLRTGKRVNIFGMAMPGAFLPQRIRQILEGRPAPRMTRVRIGCAAGACAIVSAMFAAGDVDRQKPEQAATPVSIPVSQQRAADMRVSTPPAPEPPYPRDRHTSPARTEALLAQTQASAAPASPAPPQKDRRLIALYFDMAAMPESDLARALAAAQKFVQTRAQPEDLLAIMTFSRGRLQVKQDFTGDRDQLLKILQQLVDASGQDSSVATSDDYALAGLQTVVQKLGLLDGKKLLIYFASGLERSSQAQLQATIEAAQRAGVAFYSIDSRGLIAQPGGK